MSAYNGVVDYDMLMNMQDDSLLSEVWDGQLDDVELQKIFDDIDEMLNEPRGEG